MERGTPWRQAGALGQRQGRIGLKISTVGSAHQRILSGKLSLLTKLSGGKAVVEVGTGAGVSSLWLLSGMSEDGVLTTIDIEPEYQRIARQAFSDAGISPSRTGGSVQLC
jgi:predicted O-methyltransferase YrrM